MMSLAASASPGSQQGVGGDLTGKVWAVIELSGKLPMAGTGLSAQFTADGKVSGPAGYDRYSGTHTITGNSITLSPQKRLR